MHIYIHESQLTGETSNMAMTVLSYFIYLIFFFAVIMKKRRKCSSCFYKKQHEDICCIKSPTFNFNCNIDTCIFNYDH